MKMKLEDGMLIVKEADAVQFSVIKSWGKMKWSKPNQALIGTADIELLDRMASIVRLLPYIEQYRVYLHRVQDAVDRERINPEPIPMYNYPVKLPLYKHQIRACNMCLLTFGMVEPSEVANK